MHPNALLSLATQLLLAVSQLDAPADATVGGFFAKHRMLGARDRRVLADTVFAVLRQRSVLSALTAGAGPDRQRRMMILAWSGDRAELDRALTDDERRWLDQALATDVATLPPAVRRNLPPWLDEALRSSLPDSSDAELDALAQALLAPAPLDLRVNTMKAKRDDIRLELQQAGLAVEPTPYSPWGLRVQGKPSLEKLAPYLRGDIEVQDEGSQLLALLMEARRGETIVDFCAGAGGKTLAIGAAMRGTGRLYAIDTSGHRLDALKPRLVRSGLNSVYTMQIAHEQDERLDRLDAKADGVFVDAPCSGLGTLRRNPDLKWRQSAQKVAAMHAAQLAILGRAARLVKPGGRLLYATCSLLHDEGEAIGAAFEAQGGGFARVPPDNALARLGLGAHGLSTADGGFRLWPHRHGTDGFFAAVWQRG